MKRILLALAISLPLTAQALDPTPGSYKLTGTNPGNPEKGYSGSVTIVKDGEAYRLHWYIGGNQQQEGVAYVDGDVLSVGYRDFSGLDSGVVSFHVVSERKLEGKWCPQRSSVCGTELLELEVEARSGMREEKAKSLEPTEDHEREPASVPLRKPDRFTI